MANKSFIVTNLKLIKTLLLLIYYVGTRYILMNNL